MADPVDLNAIDVTTPDGTQTLMQEAERVLQPEPVPELPEYIGSRQAYQLPDGNTIPSITQGNVDSYVQELHKFAARTDKTPQQIEYAKALRGAVVRFRQDYREAADYYQFPQDTKSYSEPPKTLMHPSLQEMEEDMAGTIFSDALPEGIRRFTAGVEAFGRATARLATAGVEAGVHSISRAAKGKDPFTGVIDPYEAAKDRFNQVYEDRLDLFPSPRDFLEKQFNVQGLTGDIMRQNPKLEFMNELAPELARLPLEGGVFGLTQARIGKRVYDLGNAMNTSFKLGKSRSLYTPQAQRIQNATFSSMRREGILPKAWDWMIREAYTTGENLPLFALQTGLSEAGAATAYVYQEMADKADNNNFMKETFGPLSSAVSQLGGATFGPLLLSGGVNLTFNTLGAMRRYLFGPPAGSLEASFSSKEAYKGYKIFKAGLDKMAPEDRQKMVDHFQQLKKAMDNAGIEDEDEFLMPLSVAMNLNYLRALEEQPQSKFLTKFMSLDLSRGKDSLAEQRAEAYKVVMSKLDEFGARIGKDDPVGDLVRRLQSTMDSAQQANKNIIRMETTRVQRGKHMNEQVRKHGTKALRDNVGSDVDNPYLSTYDFDQAELLYTQRQELNTTDVANLKASMSSRVDTPAYNNRGETLNVGREAAEHATASGKYEAIPGFKSGDTVLSGQYVDANGDTLDVNSLYARIKAAAERDGISDEISGLSNKTLRGGEKKTIDRWWETMREDTIEGMDADEVFERMGDTEALFELRGAVAAGEIDADMFESIIKDAKRSLAGDFDFEVDVNIPLSDLHAIASKFGSDAVRMQGTPQGSLRGELASEIRSLFKAAENSGEEWAAQLADANHTWRTYSETWRRNPIGVDAVGKTAKATRKGTPESAFRKFIVPPKGMTHAGTLDVDGGARGTLDQFVAMYGANNPEAIELLNEAYRREVSKKLAGKKNVTKEDLQAIFEGDGDLAEFKRTFHEYLTGDSSIDIDGVSKRAMDLDEGSAVNNIAMERLQFNTNQQAQALMDKVSDLDTKLANNLKRSVVGEIGGKSGVTVDAAQIRKFLVDGQNINKANLRDLLVQVPDAKEDLRGIIFSSVIDDLTKIGDKQSIRGLGEGLSVEKTTDGLALKSFLDDNIDSLRLLYSQEELETLGNISTLLGVLEKPRAGLAALQAPSELTIPGLLSRGYAISRGVTSVRWTMSDLMMRSWVRHRWLYLQEFVKDPNKSGKVLERILEGDTTPKTRARFGAVAVGVLLRNGYTREAADLARDNQITGGITAEETIDEDTQGPSLVTPFQ